MSYAILWEPLQLANRILPTCRYAEHRSSHWFANEIYNWICNTGVLEKVFSQYWINQNGKSEDRWSILLFTERKLIFIYAIDSSLALFTCIPCTCFVGAIVVCSLILKYVFWLYLVIYFVGIWNHWYQTSTKVRISWLGSWEALLMVKPQ